MRVPSSITKCMALVSYSTLIISFAVVWTRLNGNIETGHREESECKNGEWFGKGTEYYAL